MPVVNEAVLPVASAREDGLPVREVRDMPEPPRNYWRLVGPGIVAGGVGLSSGEFVLVALHRVAGRPRCCCGARLSASSRSFFSTWKSSATRSRRARPRSRASTASGSTGGSCSRCWATSRICGRDGRSARRRSRAICSAASPTIIAVVSLLVIGFSLTFAPVIYVALERLIFVKVAAVLVLVDPRDGVRDRTGVVAGAACRLRQHRHDSRGLEHRVDLRRDRVCRLGRRAESVSEQLDSRQGIRHGAVRAAGW